jgi:fatty acid desaturase/ketosteroid isomerase-like protein
MAAPQSQGGRMSDKNDRAIPARLNLAVSAAAIAASAFCLWYAAHASAWWGVAVAALVFSFTNNTIFALHHEAVHGTFSPQRRINEAAGTVFAAFFPTIFSVQRVSHLGHHRRNRTDRELYDYYLPHQSWLLKTYWIYCLLTGFYWSIIPVACLVYMLWPFTFRSAWFQKGPARWWGFEPFVADIALAPIRRLWLEGLVSLLLQITLFAALDLSFTAWIICYWAFGVNWASVQYTDHAGSPRDVVEGAWNLKFSPLGEALFLNYNFHLVHHREPAIPWIHLPRYVRSTDPNPSFWSIYRRLWLGARPAPDGAGPEPLPKPVPVAPRGSVARHAVSRVAVGLVLAFLLATPSLAQSTGTPEDHAALRQLRDDVVEAVNNRDYAMVRKVLHEPFMATLVTQDSFADFDQLKSYFEGLYTRPVLRMKRVALAVSPDDYSQIFTGTFAINKGSTKEHYELADGRSFDLNGRWTAVTLKQDDGWKVLAVHDGVDFLENPVITAVEQSIVWFAAGGAIAGLLIGFAAGWFVRRATTTARA